PLRGAAAPRRPGAVPRQTTGPRPRGRLNRRRMTMRLAFRLAHGVHALVVALASACAGSAAQAQAIRGVTEESGFTWLSAGRVSGPASEVVAATMQRAGFTDYRAGIYPWARAYEM